MAKGRHRKPKTWRTNLTMVAASAALVVLLIRDTLVGPKG